MGRFIICSLLGLSIAFTTMACDKKEQPKQTTQKEVQTSTSTSNGLKTFLQNNCNMGFTKVRDRWVSDKSSNKSITLELEGETKVNKVYITLNKYIPDDVISERDLECLTTVINVFEESKIGWLKEMLQVAMKENGDSIFKSSKAKYTFKYSDEKNIVGVVIEPYK